MICNVLPVGFMFDADQKVQLQEQVIAHTCSRIKLRVDPFCKKLNYPILSN